MKKLIPLILILLLPNPCLSLTIIPGMNENLPGMNTVGGSGRHIGTPATTVIAVTNLNDDGAGSFRNALEDQAGPKTIVFETSGTIDLATPIKIGGFAGGDCASEGSYITIAGQTAPSPGIAIKGETLIIERNCHDILVQHIRFRVGENGSQNNDYIDAQRNDNHYVEGTQTPPYNIVFDHCSFSWAVDENIETGADNITYSNCIFSEGLNESIHDKGAHSRGLHSLAYNSGVAGSQDIGIVDSLFAHNYGRNPMVSAGNLFLANNVMFDFLEGIKIDDHGTTTGDVNATIAGNYLDGTDQTSRYMYFVCNANVHDDSRFYIDGTNYFDGSIQASPWDEVDQCPDFSGAGCAGSIDANKQAGVAPIWPDGYSLTSAATAKTNVLANAGTWPRDTVDLRIIADVTASAAAADMIDCISLTDADCTASEEPMICCTGAGTGNCIQNTEAGWPALAENTRSFTDPGDAVQGSGYTALEELLDDFAKMRQPDSATVTISGTAIASIVEADVVTGSKTVILTLDNDIWNDTVGADNAITSAIITGFASTHSEAAGWTAEVEANMVFGDVTRTSDRVVTIILAAEAAYDIGETETISIVIPNTATLGLQVITSSNGFTVGDEGANNTTGKAAVYNASGHVGSYNASGHN